MSKNGWGSYFDFNRAAFSLFYIWEANYDFFFFFLSFYAWFKQEICGVQGTWLNVPKTSANAMGAKQYFKKFALPNPSTKYGLSVQNIVNQ